MIQPNLGDIINDHKTQGKWKVHSGNTLIDYKAQEKWKISFTMLINFTSSKDSEEIRTLHAKSNNIEIMMGSETDDIIKEIFECSLQKHQGELEEKMRTS